MYIVKGGRRFDIKEEDKRREDVYKVYCIYMYGKHHSIIISYYIHVQIFRETSLTKEIFKNLKNRVCYWVEDIWSRIKIFLKPFEYSILID